MGQAGDEQLPAKGYTRQRAFGAAAENFATRLANDETMVLEQAADLVLKITLGIHQLCPAVLLVPTPGQITKTTTPGFARSRPSMATWFEPQFPDTEQRSFEASRALSDPP
jgi:hypothetical protein